MIKKSQDATNFTNLERGEQEKGNTVMIDLPKKSFTIIKIENTIASRNYISSQHLCTLNVFNKMDSCTTSNQRCPVVPRPSTSDSYFTCSGFTASSAIRKIPSCP
jgi:hypothetical protein